MKGKCFQNLPWDLFQQIADFLPLQEVLCTVLPLSTLTHNFVKDYWTPHYLNLRSQWLAHVANKGCHMNAADLRWREDRPVLVSGEQNETSKGVWFIKCACLRRQMWRRSIEEGSSSSFSFAETPPRPERVCNENIGGISEGQHSGVESSAPSSVASSSSSMFMSMIDTDSPLSLLRAIAQDTFVFLTISRIPQVPEWLYRALTKAVECAYITASEFHTIAGASGCSFHRSVHVSVCRPLHSHEFVECENGGEGEAPASLLGAEHLSLLDLFQVLFGSHLTLKKFHIGCSAQFSSFLSGPEIPRCPESLLIERTLASYPPTSTCGRKSPLSNESAFPYDVHYTSHFPQLQRFTVSGSYLPACLAVLSTVDDLVFDSLERITLRGAMAVGRHGLQVLASTAELPDSSPIPLQSVTQTRWWIQDVVGCLLFATNPFRSLSPSGKHRHDSLRSVFWAQRLFMLFKMERFPKLKELELRIGCGTLERRLWWSLLLNEFFLSPTLEVLEFDCPVESLTCFFASAAARTPSFFSSTTPQHGARGGGSSLSGGNVPISKVLLSPPERFPSLRLLRLTSANTMDDVQVLEKFITAQLNNGNIRVQVRRLHLFALSKSLRRQAQLYRMEAERIFVQEAPRHLVLDFSSTVLPGSAVHGRSPRWRHHRADGSVHMDDDDDNHFDDDDNHFDDENGGEVTEKGLSTVEFPAIDKLTLLRFNAANHLHLDRLNTLRFPHLQQVTVRVSIAMQSHLQDYLVTHPDIATAKEVSIRNSAHK